jgi:hypothetical protein
MQLNHCDAKVTAGVFWILFFPPQFAGRLLRPMEMSDGNGLWKKINSLMFLGLNV